MAWTVDGDGRTAPGGGPGRHLTSQAVGAVTTTARCALGDFGKQVLDSTAVPIYVENMPFAVDRGPFILLEYDFTYAYRQRWQGVDSFRGGRY